MVNELKRRIVRAAYEAKEGHIASAFSVLDILWTLYDGVLRPEDRFILSKGHGALALYAVLSEKGLFPFESFGEYRSALGGHPDRNKVPGVLASTGSLGHGFPMAVGVALAKKIKKEPGVVYCLVGDGECNEGSVWEAAMLAAHHRLDNLVVIVDHDHSTDRALSVDSLTAKFRAFGFDSGGINGHNPVMLRHLRPILSAPTAVVAETVKGNGCARMQSPPGTAGRLRPASLRRYSRSWYEEAIRQDDDRHPCPGRAGRAAARGHRRVRVSRRV